MLNTVGVDLESDRLHVARGCRVGTPVAHARSIIGDEPARAQQVIVERREARGGGASLRGHHQAGVDVDAGALRAALHRLAGNRAGESLIVNQRNVRRVHAGSIAEDEQSVGRRCDRRLCAVSAFRQRKDSSLARQVRMQSIHSSSTPWCCRLRTVDKRREDTMHFLGSEYHLRASRYKADGGGGARLFRDRACAGRNSHRSRSARRSCRPGARPH